MRKQITILTLVVLMLAGCKAPNRRSQSLRANAVSIARRYIKGESRFSLLKREPISATFSSDKGNAPSCWIVEFHITSAEFHDYKSVFVTVTTDGVPSILGILAWRVGGDTLMRNMKLVPWEETRSIGPIHKSLPPGDYWLPKEIEDQIEKIAQPADTADS